MSEDQIDIVLASLWLSAGILSVVSLLWLSAMIYPAAVLTLITGGGVLAAGRRA